jgi:hypothetical protein
MSVQLPKYVQQVDKQTQSINPPAKKTSSKQEFVSPIPDAIANAGETLEKHAKLYANYVSREQERQRQDLIINTANKITAGIDDLLYDNTPDDKGKIKGLMYKSGTDIDNLTANGSQSIDDLIQNNLQGIDSASAEKIKQQIYTKQQQSLKLLANYEVGTKRDNSAALVKARFSDDIKTAGGISDSESLHSLMKNVESYVSDNLVMSGTNDEIIKTAQSNAREELVKSSLATLLEVGNTKAAREILESCKDKVSPGFFAKSNNLVRGKEIDDVSSNIWNNAQNVRTAQGYVDLNYLYGLLDKTALNDKEKKTVYSNLSSAVAADKQRILQERSDADRDFENQIQKMFKEKQDYKEAVKFAANSGFDAVDISLKQKYVDSVFFEKEGKSDPTALLNLYDKQFSGELTKDDVDNAYAAGEIRSDDWMKLRKDFANKGFNLVDGTYAQGQQIKSVIDAFAKANASDDYTQAEIKTFFYGQLRGKPYDEARKTFEDLQKAPGIFNFTPNYEKQIAADRDYRELSSKYTNVFMDETGKRNLSAARFIDGIKKGAELQKIDNFNADTIDDIVDFCGAENLKNPASAQFQAVKYLTEKNKPITIPNLDRLIKSQN